MHLVPKRTQSTDEIQWAIRTECVPSFHALLKRIRTGPSGMSAQRTDEIQRECVPSFHALSVFARGRPVALRDAVTAPTPTPTLTHASLSATSTCVIAEPEIRQRASRA